MKDLKENIEVLLQEKLYAIEGCGGHPDGEYCYCDGPTVEGISEAAKALETAFKVWAHNAKSN